MEMVINKMSAAVAGEVTTLTKTAGISEARPLHLDPTSIVITLNANTAEFFKAAATGLRYTVIFRAET